MLTTESRSIFTLSTDDIANTAATTGRATPGSSVTSEIDTLGDRDWFALDVVAGRTYRITLRGADDQSGSLDDPYLSLFRQDGSLITFDDDGGEGRNSAIVFTATFTGRIFIEARSWEDRTTGSYRLEVTERLPNAADPPGLASSATPTDPLFAQQWHLQGGAGINVVPVWADYTGQGVRVGVMDSGIDGGHRDLDDNYDFIRSRAGFSLQPAGEPLQGRDNHGTAVSGTLAAERNGFGGVGVAYNADLIAFYDPLNTSLSVFAQSITNTFRDAARDLHVLNNSWGFGNNFQENANSAFIGNFRTTTLQPAGRALEDLAATGRDGLGTIVVQSAGNAFAHGDNTNLSNFHNSRFVVTVGATDRNGAITSFSSPGSSILVAAPGQSITTTDRAGTDGYGAEDFTTISGTSFSAPIVSGVVALMLQANPRLGYRDVQEILAATARPIVTGTEFAQTGGQGWNGGGMLFSERAGFGLVDARAAVRLAETWTQQNTHANEATLFAFGTSLGGTAIPDGDRAGVSSRVTVTGDLRVERVEVDVLINHAAIGQLQLFLVSPSGTRATLLSNPGATTSRPDGSTQANINFTFGAATFRGEAAAGTWTLIAVDTITGAIGTLQSWALRTYGSVPGADDVYIYTDQFAAVAEAGGPRTRLTDTDGGRDTVNAAAVSGNVVIDLSGGPSTIAGRELTIAAGTIEVAHGGDGNDRLIAGADGAELHGGRGADTIEGGAGADALYGGAGDDRLSGADGADWIDGDGGRDVIYGGGGNDSVRGLDGDDWIDGGPGADDVNGNIGNDTVYGGDGADVWVRGGRDNDLVHGGFGDDLHVNGNIGNDTVYGDDGNDVVFGGQDNDLLYGGPGNDTLSGDRGDDTLHGGPGADAFLLRLGGGQDVVMDFSILEGDRIVIEGGAAPTFTTGAAGELIIGLSDGSSVRLIGVSFADLGSVFG